MAKGILGKKIGMTQIFEADGRLILLLLQKQDLVLLFKIKPKKQTVIMLFNLALVKLKKTYDQTNERPF